MPKTNNNKSASDAPNGRRGYRGLSAQQLDAERRTRIMDAATGLFAAHGYNATRIDTICRQARVSTRHFYELFDGRCSVLATVYDAALDALRATMREAMRRRGVDRRQRLADAAEAGVLLLLSSPARGRIICIEVVGVSSALEQKRLQSMAEFAGDIARQMDRMAKGAQIPAGDYYLPALGSIGMLRELTSTWLAGGSPLPADDMAGEARRMFVAMLDGVMASNARAG